MHPIDLLYWYKFTNTDAERAVVVGKERERAGERERAQWRRYSF